jgi:hypothetical protein
VSWLSLEVLSIKRTGGDALIDLTRLAYAGSSNRIESGASSKELRGQENLRELLGK